MQKPTIALVGTGRMGANMARHLFDTGYTIGSVYDINTTSAQELATEINGHVASTLQEVTASADVILTVVTDDAAMRSIFFNKEDNLFLGSKGKTFINCATLSPAIFSEVEAAAEANDAFSLEACMASSITQAREGTLYLMIGGDESCFQSNKPLLEELSTALRYVGPSGSAAKVKALVNMVMNINTAALAEGLGLAEALDLDLQMMREIFSQTGANSRVLETDAEDMQTRDHECYFSAAHAAKDSGIANELAESVQLNLPLSKATQKQYEKLIDSGLGDLDKSGIAELTFRNRMA